MTSWLGSDFELKWYFCSFLLAGLCWRLSNDLATSYYTLNIHTFIHSVLIVLFIGHVLVYTKGETKWIWLFCNLKGECYEIKYTMLNQGVINSIITLSRRSIGSSVTFKANELLTLERQFIVYAALLISSILFICRQHSMFVISRQLSRWIGTSYFTTNKPMGMIRYWQNLIAMVSCSCKLDSRWYVSLATFRLMIIKKHKRFFYV